jgi:uncharacterized protein (TIGR02452 family)
MIKRDGVALMNARTGNVPVAKETLDVLQHKGYVSPSGKQVDISEMLDAALQGTVLYKPDSHLPDTDWVSATPIIEVTNETTANAAVRLGTLGKTDIVALNFASGRNPGGGFLSGAVAQEEDLCRCSGLYLCIKNKPVFYNENILCDHAYYTDNVIYSPKVPFIRNDKLEFLEEPFELSIITAPAPNVRAIEEVDNQRLNNVLYNRTVKILQVAASHGYKNIILGAWGCGAFGNSPEMVAKIFMEGLKLIPAFEHVTFAVYDKRENTPLFAAFNKIVMGI